MKRKHIRWFFLIAFTAFAVLMKQSGLLNQRPSLFIILWLLASYVAVFGVVYFRDKEATEGILTEVKASEVDPAK